MTHVSHETGSGRTTDTTAPSSRPAAIPRGLAALVKTEMARLSVPGVTVGLLVDGAVSISAFGVADIATGRLARIIHEGD